MRRWAIPFVAVALVLAGCGVDTPDGGRPPGTLAVNWGGFPQSWAPGEEMEAGYLRVPYETLVALDRHSGEITPVLATAWEQTDRALTLTLRRGVVFHDGTPFDAAAVKANLESVRDGRTAFSGPLKAIASVDVVDDHTVRLNLAQPTPSLLTTLSTRVAPMASPRAIADGSIAHHPVGTGPWAYDPAASEVGTRLTFTYFPQYWGGREGVGFDTIELYAIGGPAALDALTTGEVDITSLRPAERARIVGAAGVESLSYPAIRNNPIFFDRGPGGMFADVAMRRAVCSALDTQAVAELEPHLTPRTQHFADGELGFNPGITGYPHDLTRARQLYEQAGSPDVIATVIAAPFTQRQVQAYADQLAQIGLYVRVDVASPPQYSATWNSGRYPFGLGSNDELTPYDWYRAWFAADAPGNPSGVESPRLRAAADAAIAAGTTPQAEQLWAEVTRVIADEALTCGHMVGDATIAWQSERVQGVAAPVQPWEPNMVDYRGLRSVDPR